MPIRHLSYISTDLFWTKVSTANIKVAFLSLGQGSFVWEKPFYIQSHKVFPIQKICGRVTKKYFAQNPKSAIHQLAQKPPTGKNKPPAGNIPKARENSKSDPAPAC